MKIFLWAMLTLFIVGCSSDGSRESKQEVVQVEEIEEPIVVAQEVKIEKKVDKVATKEVKKVVVPSKAQVFVSSAIYQKCKSCHGEHGEKKAMNQSQIIAGWSAEKTAQILHGYKNGTYGGNLKGVMKAQVASLGTEDIQSVAQYIATLK